MKAVLKIEAIGYDTDRQIDLTAGLYYACGLKGLYGEKPKKRYWCAEITGFDRKYKFSRNFIREKKDFSKSNSKGSRGVYFCYNLTPGKIYQVCSPKSWKNIEKYFCCVNSSGKIEILSEGEVIKWLSENTLE